MVRSSCVALLLALGCQQQRAEEPKKIHVTLSVDGAPREPIRLAPDSLQPLSAVLESSVSDWQILYAKDGKGRRGVNWRRDTMGARRVLLGHGESGVYLTWTGPRGEGIDAALTLTNVASIELQRTPEREPTEGLEIRVKGRGMRRLTDEDLTKIEQISLEAPERKREIRAWRLIDVIGAAARPDMSITVMAKDDTLTLNGDQARGTEPLFVLKRNRTGSLSLIEAKGEEREQRLTDVWGVRVSASSKTASP